MCLFISGHGPFSHMFDGKFIPRVHKDRHWKVSPFVNTSPTPQILKSCMYAPMARATPPSQKSINLQIFTGKISRTPRLAMFLMKVFKYFSISLKRLSSKLWKPSDNYFIHDNYDIKHYWDLYWNLIYIAVAHWLFNWTITSIFWAFMFWISLNFCGKILHNLILVNTKKIFLHFLIFWEALIV